MNVSRTVVSQITRDLYPVGVDARQRRALRRRLYYGKSRNSVLHLDGCDSFKPFGSTDVMMDTVDEYYG